MRKWIWTFGVSSPYRGKYVVVNTNKGDGREFVFEKFGRQNCSMSYLYNKGIEIVKKHGYQCIGEFEL